MMVFSPCQEKSVRISSIIAAFSVAFSFLWGEEVSLVVQVKGDSANTQTVERSVKGYLDLAALLDSLEGEFRHRGSLKASVRCVSVQASPGTGGCIRTLWEVKDASPVSVDSIAVSGSTRIHVRTLSKMLMPLNSELASERTLLKARHLLNGYGFLTVKGSPYYASYGGERIALVIPVEEQFRNAFSGTAGFRPGPGEIPQITGEIQLHLENPFGSASSMDLMWQRKDAESQILSLSYEEPFVWKSSLGAKFRFYQNLQDGSYVIRKSRISAVKSYSTTGKWSLGVENVTVNVTSDGDSLGLGNHTVRSMVVENEWERRDFFLNPTRGFFLNWSVEAGNFSPAGGHDAILYRIQSRFEVLKALSGRWLMSIGGTGGYVHVTGGMSVPPGEQFRYGGTSSLRGYPEQLFHSSGMVIGQAELRYRVSRYGRFYFFADGAYHNALPKFPFSGGLGLQQSTPVGIFRIEYAMNRGDIPSRGKIHLRLVSQF